MANGRQHLVVFGLTISSTWSNGHAPFWRALAAAWTKLGNTLTFFEKDVTYFAKHRDYEELDGVELLLYRDLAEIDTLARRELAGCDVAMVTSYCPDALDATRLVTTSSAPLKLFYDLDARETLHRVERRERIDYIGRFGLSDFDVVLSVAGGKTLEVMKSKLSARFALPLYPCVDALKGAPVNEPKSFDLSYVAAFGDNRQAALDPLFLEPARKRVDMKFIVGGSMYPSSFPWQLNIHYREHLPPVARPAFFAGSRATLNVMNGHMLQMGSCPSERLFEAAWCGTPVLTEPWDGLENFFTPDEEIFVVRNADDVLRVLDLPAARLEEVGQAARLRVMAQHTADVRARELRAIVVEATKKKAPQRKSEDVFLEVEV